MTTIKRIFKRENILVLTLVFVAFLGIFGVPQILGVTSEQIVLLLLGVLALDMLIERLGYLERIENKLSELANKIQPKISIDSLFLPRGKMGSFEPRISAGNDIWVASRTLQTFMKEYEDFIQNAARQGKKFKFLLVNPENYQALNAIVNTRTGGEYSHVSSAITEALDIMKRIRDNVPSGSIEIKIANFVPLNLFRIVDPNKETGEIIIEYYGYKISTARRKHFVVNKKRDPETFSFYLDQFEQMWNDGISV